VLNVVIKIIRKMKIYPRLIVSFIIIMVTASTVISGYNTENYANKVKLSYYKNLEYTINISATLIQSILRRYEQLGNRVFDDKSVMGMLRLAERKAQLIDNSGYGLLYERQYQSYKHNIGNRLHEIYKNDKYIKGIFYIVEDRQYEIYDINFVQQGGLISDFEGFIQSDSYKQILISGTMPSWLDINHAYFDFYTDDGSQDTILMLAMNNYDFNDELNGTLIICIDMIAITEMFSSYTYDGDGNVLLITESSTQVSLQESKKNETTPADYEALKMIGTSDSSIKEEKINGVKSIVAYTKISNTNMYAINISDYSNLLKGFESIKSSNYVMIIAILLLSIVIHYFITLSITIPLNSLKKTMDMIADDNFDNLYIDNTKDEIASIGFHFNKLVKRIKALIDEIYITKVHQKELDFRKKNAELIALQAQINPHFIYNTLDIIRWQAIKEVGTDSKANRMIIDFSNMLRIGTEKSKDIVPIMEEIEHVKAYVKLVNYKFLNNPIQFEMNLDFDTYNQFLTKLTLQPIVENCVLHGFENKMKDKKISIVGEVRDDKLYIFIEDNGGGMTEEVLQTIRRYINKGGEDDPSIGLRNVCERLHLFFGKESLMEIDSTIGRGTKVTVVVPYPN
jgi:two-component system, sensor histidine kinase YesM